MEKIPRHVNIDYSKYAPDIPEDQREAYYGLPKHCLLYTSFVYGEGNHAANAQEAIEASYAADVTDEFVIPVVTCEGGRVEDGDTVIFMNFRPDRARQMTRIFCDDAFTGFERRGGRKQVHYVCMAEYDATMPNCEVAYPPVELKNVLGEYLSAHGKTQLRIAENEKYAHVTFFFNGGVEAPYELSLIHILQNTPVRGGRHR